MENIILEELKKLKKGHSYAVISQMLKIPEKTLIRWIKGQTKISPAYQELLKRAIEVQD